MRGIQEEEKEIQVKLPGMNVRSYLDVAKKQASSAIIAEQDELEIDQNNSQLPTLQQYQQNRSFQKQPYLENFTIQQTNNDLLVHKYQSCRVDSLQQFPDQNKQQQFNIHGIIDEEQKQQKANQTNIQQDLINTSLGCSQFNHKNNIPLFNPENKIRILVNGLIVCYNCFYLFTISLTLFFKAEIQDYQHLFHYVAIVAWIFEMVLQMNTATYHEGDFITDRKTIFRIYVKEYFFFEVLPLVFEGKTSTNPTINIFLHLPLLLKLKGMSIILSKLEFLILQHLHKPHVMQICKKLLQILLLVHLMACSYATLGNFERSILLTQENWIDLSKIQNNGYCWWTVYIEAQLWAFYTLSNSYSSSVISKYEYAFTSFWMLISYVVFAYNIINLGKIFQDINSAKENYQKDLNLLNRFMKRKKIDLELQRVINSHLIKQYEQEASTQFEAEKDTLKKLSPHMRNKLITESSKGIISQFSIFNNLSQQTIYNLYQIIEEECYSEGQDVHIFDKNTQEYFIYLIFSGKVEILQLLDEKYQNLDNQNFDSKYMNQDKGSSIQQYQKSICFLKEGNLLGEYEFFSNMSYPYRFSVNQERYFKNRGGKKSQRLIINIPTKQVISSDDDDDDYDDNIEQEPFFFQSQLNPVLEEETSILLQNNKYGTYKTNNKSKYRKEESKSEFSDPQEQEVQGEKILEQAKNNPTNITNKRQSIKSKISLLKQQRNSMERLEDLTSNQDKIDQIQRNYFQEEKSITLNIDERTLNTNCSQKNPTELSQSSSLQQQNSLMRDKSLSQVTSQQALKKQTQFQKHLTYLESIKEIESNNQIYNPNKKSELSQENILKGNTLTPLNTIQSGQLHFNKNHDQCSQMKINSQLLQKCWNESNLYWNFDKIANFIYFFPEFNYKNVLKNTKLIKDKKNTVKQNKKQII
ncbi:cation channel family protein (macronuclear) [Tetrahymena thermophila SB210]|uniref:Cation channel family protein n=1 Tax=Tetrahymena thermophila (strain SB210) TaxID=312017 RepID=W7XJA8_TETTS|nr:cation channel family protein [Tetrahymena thermophila SB210]EWS75356.1 cation channel family protein [Tetrahymena thermophila SB210]|eukprot:XP_012652116.1 cation channel family protein [Tetrahymena thermophila SB210]